MSFICWHSSAKKRTPPICSIALDLGPQVFMSLRAAPHVLLGPLHNETAGGNGGCESYVALLGLKIKGRIVAYLGIVFLSVRPVPN